MTAKGYLRFLRVRDWLHLLGLTLLGGIFASRQLVPQPALLLPALVSAFFLAYGYSLNEAFDAPVRERDGRLRFLEYPFSRRAGVMLSAACLVPCAALALLHSAQLFAVICCGAFFGWLYSAPPARVKNIPFAGWLVNSLCFTPPFLAGALAFAPFDARMAAAALYVAVVLLPFQLIHELDHREHDLAAGFRTTACALGAGKSLTALAGSLLFLDAYSFLLCRAYGFSAFFLTANILFSLWLWVMVLEICRREGPQGASLKSRARLIGMLYGLALAMTLC